MLLQYIQELLKFFSDTKTLNVNFRAVYYDQQLQFISTFCLEVMYLKNDIGVPAQTTAESKMDGNILNITLG